MIVFLGIIYEAVLSVSNLFPIIEIIFEAIISNLFR